MTKRLSATLLTALLALTACGAPSANTPVATPKPVKPIQSAGVFSLNLNGVGRNAQAMTSSVTRVGLSAQANEVNGLTFKTKLLTNHAEPQGGVLHLIATYTVTNNTGAPIAVPTFVPVDTSGAFGTDGETPFRNVVTRTGQPTSPAGITLERARTSVNNVIVEDPNSSAFLTNLDTGALGLTLPDATDAPGISHQGWQTKSLAPGGEVDVNFAVSIKLKGSDVGDDDPFRFSLVFAVADNPGTVALDNIAALQGSTPSGDAASPVSGSTRTVEGIVTSVNTGTNLNGFWIQEEGIDRDADAASSDGIFVYCGTASGNCPAVTLGQRVRVTGVVSEYVKATQLAPASAAGVVSVASNVPLPAAQALTLPLPVTDRERFEGMRVTVSGKVTNNFPLGRYGSFDIADDRIMNFTQLNTPDATANAAYQLAAKDRSIRIDDGSRAQNPDPEIFARGGQPLSAANTMRGGDQVTATGILTFGNDSTNTTGSTSGGAADTYRIQATQADAQITDANPRLTTPESVGGTTRVGSMNVLNYFTTLTTSNDGCTPNGFDSTKSNGQFIMRGADTCEEFLRQQTKIVKAIAGLNPDVLGILEMQNDFDKGANSSIANLVNALNAEVGAGTFAYINPGKKVGGDAISVAMIYKPGNVDPVGNLAILDNSVNATYGDTCNRPTWAQTFQSKANGGRFTAVMMHLKSKGSACGAFNDADTGDGQGNGYIARRNAARAIVSWLGTNPTGVTEDDRVLMGDYNAYASEEPLTILAQGGYANVFDKNVYSYQFDGQWGSLDQATATSSMINQVAGHTKWHINSDEPTVLDYNKDFKSTGQLTSFYAADPFRSSDHDPILIGLNLNAQAPLVVTNPTTSLTPTSASANVNLGSSATQTFTTSSTDITTLNVATTLSKTDGAAVGTNPTVTAPTTATPNGTFDVTLTSAADTTPGAYRVTVGTSSGSASASATYDVNVNGILLSAPSNLSYGAADAATGATTSAAVTAYGAGTVSYSATAAGAGAPSITVTPGTTSGNTIPLTITATGGNAGTYTATLTATGTNGQTASKSFTVTVTSSGVGKLVISEFRFRGPSGGNDEFVELVNMGTAPLDISGYQVQAYSTSAWANRVTIPANTVLQPGQFFLATNTGSSGYSLTATGDATYNIGFTDNRAVRVTLSNGTTALDTVGFVTTGVPCEGTCLSAGPTAGVTTQISWARNVANGQFVDTDNNVSDFTYRDGASSGTANPQNKAVIFSGTN